MVFVMHLGLRKTCSLGKKSIFGYSKEFFGNEHCYFLPNLLQYQCSIGLQSINVSQCFLTRDTRFASMSKNILAIFLFKFAFGQNSKVVVLTQSFKMVDTTPQSNWKCALQDFQKMCSCTFSCSSNIVATPVASADRELHVSCESVFSSCSMISENWLHPNFALNLATVVPSLIIASLLKLTSVQFAAARDLYGQIATISFDYLILF